MTQMPTDVDSAAFVSTGEIGGGIFVNNLRAEMRIVTAVVVCISFLYVHRLHVDRMSLRNIQSC